MVGAKEGGSQGPLGGGGEEAVLGGDAGERLRTFFGRGVGVAIVAGVERRCIRNECDWPATEFRHRDL